MARKRPWSRGARPPSGVVGCAPRPTCGKSTGLRPHIFRIGPRGRVPVRPRRTRSPGRKVLPHPARQRPSKPNWRAVLRRRRFSRRSRPHPWWGRAALLVRSDTKPTTRAGISNRLPIAKQTPEPTLPSFLEKCCRTAADAVHRVLEAGCGGGLGRVHAMRGVAIALQSFEIICASHSEAFLQLAGLLSELDGVAAFESFEIDELPAKRRHFRKM
jgi:hypothetical protein